MVCELATPRGSLFTPLDRTPPYSDRLHSSLLVHSLDHIPPSWLTPCTTHLPPGSLPGPHTSLLVHSLDHTPPSWFTPWTTLLSPGSVPGPNSCLLFHSLGQTPPSTLVVHSPVSPLLPPGTLLWVPTPPSWFTALGPYASLLVHSLGPPLSTLPPCSPPWTPTPPSHFHPQGPHSSVLPWAAFLPPGSHPWVPTPPSWGFDSFCCACASTIRLSGSSRAVAAHATVALVQRTAGMQLPLL